MERTAELRDEWPMVTTQYSALASGDISLEQLSQLIRLGPEDHLASAAASGALLDQLHQMDLDAANEATLVEIVAAANRLAASATAVMNRAAGVLAERDPLNSPELAAHSATPDGEDPNAGCTAADELAPRLGWTRRATRDLTRRGQALSTYLMNTGDALSSGLIDSVRANALVDALQDVAWQAAMAVEDEVLPRAPYRTAGQIRQDVAKAIIAVDPIEAQHRAEARRRKRRVGRPRALPDETAAMTIEGPAADVLGLDVALDSAARAAKAEGDTRSLEQLRFDLLAAEGSAALARGSWTTGDGALPLASIGGRRPEVHVVVPLDQLLPPAREGSPLRDGAGDSAQSTAVVPPFGPVPGRDDGGARDAETEAHTEPAPSIGCDGDLSVPRLTGYGPITPTTARALAAGGTWRRLVTDPLSGQLLDLGHARYRPSTALADHVRARDNTCVRPGCSTPARESQLDHTRPWLADGTGGGTDADNLGPLCLRDHQVKTHGDFQVKQIRPGIFEWRTPTGHRYRRDPDGSTIPLSHHQWDRPPPF